MKTAVTSGGTGINRKIQPAHEGLMLNVYAINSAFPKPMAHGFTDVPPLTTT